MKRKILMLVLVGVLLSAAVATTTVWATTGCFTDTIGLSAEPYICWAVNNGITAGCGTGLYCPNNAVTRAQMAVFMQRLRSTGTLAFNIGPNDWQVNGNSASTGYIRYFTSLARLQSTGAVMNYYQTSIPIPSDMYNTLMYVTGAKLCYDASFGGAVLSEVQFQHRVWDGTIYDNVVDSTDRTDNTCRTYDFGMAGSVWGSDYVSMYIGVDFSSSMESLDIYSLTVYMRPALDGAPPVHGPERETLEIPLTGGGEAP